MFVSALYTHTLMYVCVYNMLVYVCICVHMYVQVCVHMCGGVHVWVCVGVCMCMRVHNDVCNGVCVNCCYTAYFDFVAGTVLPVS